VLPGTHCKQRSANLCIGVQFYLLDTGSGKRKPFEGGPQPEFGLKPDDIKNRAIDMNYQEK
jgi:hypothetical protein